MTCCWWRLIQPAIMTIRTCRIVDVLPGLKAGASTPPDGSAVAPAGPPPFLPALKDGVSRRIWMNDAAYLILIWSNTYHVRWNFVKGWTHTPNIRGTNAKMDYCWLDLPELPHAR